MQAFCRRVCGVALSVLMLGGCALIDGSLLPKQAEPANSPAPPPAAQQARAQPPKRKRLAYEAADLKPIPDPEPEVIRNVQAALNEAGFPVGRPDGQIGKRTLHGLRLYKVARRMPVTNDITPALLTSLAVRQARPAGQ